MESVGCVGPYWWFDPYKGRSGNRENDLKYLCSISLHMYPPSSSLRSSLFLPLPSLFPIFSPPLPLLPPCSFTSFISSVFYSSPLTFLTYPLPPFLPSLLHLLFLSPSLYSPLLPFISLSVSLYSLPLLPSATAFLTLSSPLSTPLLPSHFFPSPVPFSSPSISSYHVPLCEEGIVVVICVVSVGCVGPYW